MITQDAFTAFDMIIESCLMYGYPIAAMCTVVYAAVMASSKD